MDDETSTGGKIAVFFVTLIIILIWLAIIVLLIRVRCRRFRIIRSGAGVKGCSLCEQNPAGQRD